MAINDIYRITATQRYGASGPMILNVFYYQQNAAGLSEGADPLRISFTSTVMEALRLIQNETIQWLQIDVENIVPSADNSGEGFVPGTVAGQRIGECLPPFAVWAFRFNRSTAASRNGQKRIAGVTELDQQNGVAVPALTTPLTGAATAMGAVLGGPLTGTATYVPVIFRAGRPVQIIPEKTIPAKLQAVFPIDNVVYTTISTQNTRKFGVGI